MINLSPISHFPLQAFETEKDLPSFSGISGGRTSGLMHILLPANVSACFENTGREHPKTLEFLARIEDASKKPVKWLEFTPPPRFGMAPKHSGFKVVNYDTANRTGEPFEALLETLAQFRAEVKGLGPIVPWARQRLCTAYLKIRVQRQYALSLGAEEHVSYIGLRADEPSRVAQMKDRDSSKLEHRAPLHMVGMTKADVNRFWSAQSFDLEISDYQGNCTGCFLKDEADLTTVMTEEETDTSWWLRVQEKYGQMRPRAGRTYAQLLEESDERMGIRSALAAGTEAPAPSKMTARRHKFVIIQEKKRAIARESFSCGCEGAERLADDEAETAILEAEPAT